MIHLGHIRALQKARTYGDYLIVAVLSDERVKAKKGSFRPIIPAYERIEILKSIKFVDEVNCLVGIDKFPMLSVIELCEPDVVVMDDNEHPDTLAVEQRCREKGIEFIKLTRILTDSKLDTTKIIEKIQTHST